MSTNPEATAPATSATSGYSAAKIVYILYLVGFFLPFVALGGLVYAYMSKGEGEGSDSHMSFAIQTFWYGLLWLLVSGVLSLVLIGWLVGLAWIVWTLMRCIAGLKLASDNKPITKVGKFGFGAS